MIGEAALTLAVTIHGILHGSCLLWMSESTEDTNIFKYNICLKAAMLITSSDQYFLYTYFELSHHTPEICTIIVC